MLEKERLNTEPTEETQEQVESPQAEAASASIIEMTEDDNPSIKAEQPAVLRIPKTVKAQPVPVGAELDDPALYFNRELGWIDFNWRVLYLAIDERTPLLERVRFVAITASNLDEFVQKRVGGLKRQEWAGVRALSPDGRTPTEQLELLREAIPVMQQTMTKTWEQTLKPLLREQANIRIYNYAELTSRQREILHDYFRAEIYPILTPLTVDPGHPFPFISNLSLSLAILLQHPENETTHFARLKMPATRWIPVEVAEDKTAFAFLPVEQLITHHLDELFPGMELISAHPFRITRNADVRRAEEEAEDLLAMISEELRERRFSPVVRLEVDHEMPADIRRLLIRELELRPDEVHEVDGLLNLTSCFYIANLPLPQFKYKPWEPVIPSQLLYEGQTEDMLDIFAIIRQGDLLVHHPYDSFTASVQRLIEEAATDKQVLAIKQTLYRTSDESPIVKALVRAAESGKQVAVLVEVKARFDEANNIEWAQMLENSGVHVTYGLVGLKTHTKATLIVRREEHGIQTYCHIGTGNYHTKTARLYTDLGLLTCRPELGADLVNLFHYLTGYAPGQRYQKVLVAPRYMRKIFYDLIDQEVIFQAEHGNGQIIAKMNALDDVGIIKRLYQASQAGVRIELIIRGHSRLRPHLKGYSDNIRVISILGRFLEHDRIFYFHNNDRPLTFIGSADWRSRNLVERVELITPISEPALQQRLIRILEDALGDNCLAWDLDAEGNYIQRRPASGEEERNFHDMMMRQALERGRKAK
jgi:polyphosphate kinase